MLFDLKKKEKKELFEMAQSEWLDKNQWSQQCGVEIIYTHCTWICMHVYIWPPQAGLYPVILQHSNTQCTNAAISPYPPAANQRSHVRLIRCTRYIARRVSRGAIFFSPPNEPSQVYPAHARLSDKWFQKPQRTGSYLVSYFSCVWLCD